MTKVKIVPAKIQAKNNEELLKSILATIVDLYNGHVTLQEANCLDRLYKDALRSIDLQIVHNKMLGITTEIKFLLPLIK